LNKNLFPKIVLGRFSIVFQSSIDNQQSRGNHQPLGPAPQGMVLFLIVRLPCSIHAVRSETYLTGVPIRKKYNPLHPSRLCGSKI
jgi:hypothetical protein